MTSESDALRMILDLGGYAVRDDRADGKPIRKVDFSRTDVADEHLSLLAALPGLRVLSFYRCKRITDAGLNTLAKFAKLQELYLRECDAITDVGIALLAIIPLLQTLDLSHCRQVTDRGVKALAVLEQLQSLYLSGCSSVSAAWSSVAAAEPSGNACKFSRSSPGGERSEKAVECPEVQIENFDLPLGEFAFDEALEHGRPERRRGRHRQRWKGDHDFLRPRGRLLLPHRIPSRTERESDCLRGPCNS